MAVTQGHLLHVGYPKTGSKFLQRWFAAHPELVFAHWGIAGFGDAHQMMLAAAAGASGWRVTSHEALLTPLVNYGDLGSKRVSLPTRTSQRAACATMADMFPTSRVMIVTRGYESLLRSFYAELVRGGATYSFAAFCEAVLAQVEAGEDVFDFAAAIETYAAAFGEDRVLVLPYELLLDRPAAFLGAIEAALAIGPSGFAPEMVRPSPPAGRLATYRRMTRGVCAVRLPHRTRRKLAHRYIVALREGRLDWIATAIERLSGPPAGEDLAFPTKLREALAVRGARLCGDARYQSYGREYFL